MNNPTNVILAKRLKINLLFIEYAHASAYQYRPAIHREKSVTMSWERISCFSIIRCQTVLGLLN